MKFFYSIVLFVLTLTTIASAQKNGLVNSGELINKAAALYDSSQYKNALILLEKVNRSDTNYVRSIYEKAISCEADSQYNNAIKYCKEGLALKEQRAFEPDIFNTYGNTLSDMKQYQEALSVFDSAISKYPNYALLYFNKGVILMQLERPHDAELMFQKTLLISPYLYSAHYQLALSAMQQGKLIPAFLSSLGYLLCNPEGKYFSKSIYILSQISKSADEVLALKAKRKETPSADYQMIEEIVLSKIALDQQYKPITALDDQLSRQIQVVFEKLDYDAGSKDFWMQYYVPYYKKVFADKQFELFINHIFSNAKLKIIQDYNEKNKKALATFVNEAGDYFNLIRATRELVLNKRDTVTRKFIYENGKLVGRGVLSADGKMLTGPWEFLYPAGNKKGSGLYNSAGKREGEFRFYRHSGKLSSVEHYANGKLNGSQDYYYENGNTSSHEQEENDQLEGLATGYYYNGAKKSEVAYKLGKKSGEQKLYYDNGSLKELNYYVNGELSGTAKDYFKSGGVKNVAQYVDGKANGPYKSYHENGGISLEMDFVNDKTEGVWKSHYQDGKPQQVRNYIGNEENGLHQEYYENGQLSASYTAKKDKIAGEAVFYTKEGKVYSKLLYDNGVLKQAKYFNPAGQQFSTSEFKGKLLDMISFTPDGLKKEHFAYDQKGNLVGPDTLFYPSGKISQISSYTAGEQEGPLVTYFLNGKIKSRVNMKAGKEDGYYESFFINGQPQTEGWIVNGDYQGEWLNHDIAGKLTSSTYYLDSELSGYKVDYNLNGQKIIQQKYISSVLEEMTHYDDTGKAIAVDSFPKGSGKYRLLFRTGKLMAQVDMVNGNFNGAYKSYYFDGSPETNQFYKYGLSDSTYTGFYYGGKKELEGHYFKGNKTGKWISYDEDGKISRLSNFADDELNGERIYYNPDGTKDMISSYKDDELDGLTTKYDIDGSVAYQTTFESGSIKAFTYPGADGKLLPFIPIAVNNGMLKSFYANGKPSRETPYSDGEKNGKMLIYYNTGQLRSVDNTVYGNNEGPLLEYYPDGKLMTEYMYVANTIDGIAKDYYKNGKLKKEAVYVFGVNNGPVKYYDETGKLTKTLIYENDKLIAVK